MLNRLSSPPISLRDYWVVAGVILFDPIKVEDARDPLDQYSIGYYRTMGLRSREQDIKSHLVKVLNDGKIQWQDLECEEIDPNALSMEIRRCIVPLEFDGFWYMSGHIYFTQL